MGELESFESACAVRTYLEARRDGLVDWTLKSHKYRLRMFIGWRKGSGVDNLTELNGRDLYEFRVWRHEGNFGVENGGTPKEITPVTLKPQLTILRAFLRSMVNIHAIPGNFCERVPLPELPGTDDVSDSMLEPDRATDIFEYLHHYHYAPRRHVEFMLL